MLARFSTVCDDAIWALAASMAVAQPGSGATRARLKLGHRASPGAVGLARYKNVDRRGRR